MLNRMYVETAVKQAIRDIEHGHPYDNPFKPGTVMHTAYKNVYERASTKKVEFVKAK